MSAELNVQVKLTLLEGEVQKIAQKLQTAVGGSMNKSASSVGSGASEKKEAASKYNIAKFAELYLNFKLLQLALKSLSVVVNGLMDSFKKARDIYSKSLTSGLGVSMTTKAGALSQILGVNEKEVLKFGAAISYIYPQIEDSIKILEETNKPLAEVQINIEILKIKFLAASSVITSSMLPAINEFIDSISAFMDVFKDSEVIQQISATIGKAIELVGLLVSSIAFSIQFLIEGFKGLLNILVNFLALIPGLGIKRMEMTPSKLPKMFDDMGKQTAAFLGQSGKSTGGLPPAQSSMKQISASAWEKMGLVIGGRGNTTNELIRQSNKHLSIIAASVTGTGVARQSFGMNPTVANP